MPRNESGDNVNPFTGAVVFRAMTAQERAEQDARAARLAEVRAERARQEEMQAQRAAALAPAPAADSPLAPVLLARTKPNLTVRCPRCQAWVARAYPAAGTVYLLFRGIGARERSPSGARNRNRMAHLAEPLRDREIPRYWTGAFCRCGEHWIEHRRIREALSVGTRKLVDEPARTA